MNSRLIQIIRREYLERVTRKSFIFTTILTPLLMLAMMVLPALIMLMTGPENKVIAVIDQSDVIAPTLQGSDEIKFEIIADPALTVDSVKHMTDYDAILIIGRGIIDNPDRVDLYTSNAPSMQTEMFIKDQISKAIENQRIQRYQIDNLEQIINDLNVSVEMKTYRLDQEETKETSSTVSYLIGMLMAMMLYMFLIIYGQMVMNSIIEEKNNRVLEIIVSSVKPQTIMLGKIVGVGLVALTQVVIWGIMIISCSRWIMPLLSSAMTSEDTDLIAAVSQLGDVGYISMLFGYMTVFLIGGYLLYSAMFAAIGSAVDNAQDASQLTTLAMLPIILGIMFSVVVVNDPNSTMAFWLSEIPFTSPMVMMARIPFGIPSWEIWLAIALLLVTVYFMIWLAAKIYRVGIFMYGKKPSFKELVRWARYK